MPDEKPPGNPAILLRLPAAIGIPLLKSAKKSKRTVQAVILEIVAQHYAVDVLPPLRGSRPRETKRAAD